MKYHSELINNRPILRIKRKGRIIYTTTTTTITSTEFMDWIDEMCASPADYPKTLHNRPQLKRLLKL